MVTKGPFMEFLRGVVLHTGGEDVEVYEMRTPTSKTEELAMLIHQIEIRGDVPTYALASAERIMQAISSESHEAAASIPWYLDPSVLWRHEMDATEGIVVGPFGRDNTQTVIKYFDPPVLYTKTSIWLEMEMSAGQPAGKQCETLIGYTLDKVSREDFISALIAG